jgi:hypothetical protein
MFTSVSKDEVLISHELMLTLILRANVVRPSETFLGMSYSDWVTTWCNWLFSEDPDTYDGGDIVFLRGNVNYLPVNETGVGPRFLDPKAIYDRTGKNGQTIFERTAILISVIVEMLIVGELYEGKVLRTPEQLRYSANLDIRKCGPIWATIMKKGDSKALKIVNNLKKYYIATPLFKLNVLERSSLKDKADNLYYTGIHDTVAAGIFLLIKSLPPSTYRINFGGVTGAYHTDSIYDITIQGKRKETMEDVSAKRRIVKRVWR